MAVLLPLSLSVNAGIISEIPNGGGGGIALLDLPCKSVPNSFVAYSYLPDGRSVLGCWSAGGNRIFIQWSDGDMRSYPATDFIAKPAKPARIGI